MKKKARGSRKTCHNTLVDHMIQEGDIPSLNQQIKLHHISHENHRPSGYYQRFMARQAPEGQPRRHETPPKEAPNFPVGSNYCCFEYTYIPNVLNHYVHLFLFFCL